MVLGDHPNSSRRTDFPDKKKLLQFSDIYSNPTEISVHSTSTRGLKCPLSYYIFLQELSRHKLTAKMPPKKMGVSSKAAEARDRKDAKKQVRRVTLNIANKDSVATL